VAYVAKYIFAASVLDI